MSVVVSVEDVGVCRKQVKIEVPGPAVEAEANRVAQEYRKNASLPGFRKGKVPLAVVQKRFGDEIRKEVIDRLVPRYWHQAQAESGLEPLLTPSVEQVDYEGGSSLTFDAIVEVRPEIELGDIESFDLPEKDDQPTDEEIENSLEDLRRNVAEWQDADRAVARGDQVVGKITLEEGGEEGESDEPTPVSFEVGDPKVWEELTIAVTGQGAGTETEFSRQEGEDGATRKYRIEIDKVRERDLPEVDDEFAAKVGEFENVAALRAGITERLAHNKAHESRRKREQIVLEQLRERHPLQLPEGVVDRETENILRSYAEDMARHGMDPEKAEVDWQGLFQQTRPQGEKEVHSRLLLDAVVEKLEVEVSESEFEASLAALARAQGKTAPAVRQALDRAGRLGELRLQLARDKALRRLTGDELKPTEAVTSAEAAPDESE